MSPVTVTRIKGTYKLSIGAISRKLLSASMTERTHPAKPRSNLTLFGRLAQGAPSENDLSFTLNFCITKYSQVLRDVKYWNWGLTFTSFFMPFWKESACTSCSTSMWILTEDTADYPVKWRCSAKKSEVILTSTVSEVASDADFEIPFSASPWLSLRYRWANFFFRASAMRAAGSVTSTGLGFVSCSDLREMNRNRGAFQYASMPLGSASCASPQLTARL